MQIIDRPTEADLATPIADRRKMVLVIEDDATLNRLLVRQLTQAGYVARGVLRWKDAQKVLGEEEPALALLDMRLPDADGLDAVPQLKEVCPVVVLTAYGAVEHAVKALKAGATDYLVKPVRGEELELAIGRALERASLQRDGLFWKDRAQSIEGGIRMIGASAAFRRATDLVDMVAPTDQTVLVLGESGVGKELFARAIHDASSRAASKFVAIDCSTLQANLFESELFGHERGSFTGADRRKDGLVEVADGGTVFLDEIGEVSATIQAKLLRILETGMFRRLGGTKDLHADVRFVAATNRDLQEMVRAGTFRADLYYRLSRFVVEVPPLRERGEDIIAIADAFVAGRAFRRNVPKRLGMEAKKALVAYRWPGNVRELKNVVERAVLLSGDRETIGVAELGLTADPMRAPEAKSFRLEFDAPPTLEEIEREYLTRLATRTDLSRAEMAATLGISERNTYRLLAKHKLR
ncbi:sigma-54-dependent transcriptional regulator [Pinisolibacter sp.]|uniref:sigma-54-dependent transcriptional regulator n=1 Tax=Pinisolibacter sp. TaxID=2172024 RepID=UPI002FDCF926